MKNNNYIQDDSNYTVPEESIFGIVHNSDLKDKLVWSIKNNERHEIYVDIYDILFTLTVNNKSLDDNVCHLISKAIILREIKEIDLLSISKILNFMKIDKLNIVSIKDSMETINLVAYVNPSIVNYIEISVNDFISHINNPNFDFIDNNICTLYILRGGSFVDIKKLFNNVNGYNINISRGGSQKSHMLSPLDLRLSSYILAMFNFDFKYISYLNTFNDMPKHRYLPYLAKPTDLVTIDGDNRLVRKLVTRTTLLHSANKVRAFHTSTKVMDKETPIFSYLDNIENIVNNSNSLYEAQSEIEISWINLMKERLDDPNVSSWKMLPLLINKAFNTLEKVEAKGILKKRFKLLSSDISIYKKELIILTIGILISNYYRISKTNLSIQLGDSIAFYLFKQSLLKKKKK